MRPPDGGVHEDNVLVAAHIQGSALEGPSKGAPVEAHVVVIDVLGIAGQIWQGQLRRQDALSLCGMKGNCLPAKRSGFAFPLIP